MDDSAARERVIDEVNLVPQEELQALYEVVHGFRVAAAPDREGRQGLMRFAGCWADMPDGEFQDFLAEIADRRAHALSSRRSP